MTDPFTAACPLYRAAQRQSARTGNPLQVSKGHWLRPSFVLVALAVIVGIVAVTL